jgi:hypothetical protein
VIRNRFRGRRLEVRFGLPMMPAETGTGKVDKESMERFNRELRDRMFQLGDNGDNTG